MRTQISILEEVFIEWLRIHDSDNDFYFYTQKQWVAKESSEHYLADAELVVAFEDDLFSLLHYSGDSKVEEELQELAGGFGYYFEFGNAWNIGFYPLDFWPELPRESTSYSEKLQDFRWKEKRERILARCNNRCEECGKSFSSLDVHHCYYRYGRQPWQYPDGALLALCKTCHARRQEAELRFRIFGPTLLTKEIDLLREFLSHCQYWYDRDKFYSFISAFESSRWQTTTDKMVSESQEEYDERKQRIQTQFVQDRLLEMIHSAGHPDERGDEWPRNWLV